MGKKRVHLVGKIMTASEMAAYERATWATNSEARIRSGDLVDSTKDLLSNLKRIDLNRFGIDPFHYKSWSGSSLFFLKLVKNTIF